MVPSQVVQTDMKDLVDLDLHLADTYPCAKIDRKPYHISALNVVDLVRTPSHWLLPTAFKDHRITSKDPLNNMQNELAIFSLLRNGSDARHDVGMTA